MIRKSISHILSAFTQRISALGTVPGVKYIYRLFKQSFEELSTLVNCAVTEDKRKPQQRKQTIAFTLAEVLITLSIIGIVAAMTMPALLSKYREKATVSKLKKSYSVLSQGYLFAVEEYGTPDNWDITARTAENAIIVRDKLFKNVKLIQKCDDNANQKACGVSENTYYINGNIDTGVSGTSSKTAAALMADGTAVMVITNSSGSYQSRGSGVLSNVYAIIYVDTNGINPPNTYGKDKFCFYLTKVNITPVGTQDESSTYHRFENDCINTSSGLGCTAWVIYNENMDYLHCDDLSWDGKRKCN